MDVLVNPQGVKLVDSNIQQTNLAPIDREHPKQVNKYSDFTSNSVYPIFAYMFNFANIGIIEDEYDLIKFDDVIDRMNSYCTPLFNDFVETTANIPWLEVSSIFFQYAFYNDFIYVHWNEEDEKFELYIKCSAVKSDTTEDAEEKKFLNILTSKVEIFSHPEEDLIRFSWTGRSENRFQPWFKLAYSMEAKLQIFDSACMLFIKRLVLKGEQYYPNQIDNIKLLKKNLVNLSPLLVKQSKENLIEFIPPIMTAPELDGYSTAVYKWFDREVSERGRVANLNPKKQRTTTGENYMAMDRQVDYLRCTFDRLKLLSLKMAERGWPPLVFEVNTEENLGMAPKEEQQGEQGEKMGKTAENV